MSTTYILKSTNSDLGGGADFNKALETTTEAGSELTFNIGPGDTEDSFGYTPAGIPGTDGVTGDYTVEIEVVTANTNIQLSIAVARVNSAGTQQAISSFTAEQQATAGVKTFSLTGVDLGTWAAGERLKVVYRFHHTAPMVGGSIGIRNGTTDCEVVAPWTIVAGAQTHQMML